MELISVHVPKTAGTAFGTVLDQVYGFDQIDRDYAYRDAREVDAACRVIHGHFSVVKYHDMFPEAKRIAWVRHPVPWAISVYYFSRTWPTPDNGPLTRRLHEEGLSLLEFAGHPLARNQVTRNFLYGRELEEFFFVGIHEHFRDDVRTLGRMLDWPEVDVPVENLNPDPTYAEQVRRHLADRGLVRKLEQLYADDLDLYERALKLRARRLRTQGQAARPMGLFRSWRTSLTRRAS